MHSHSVGTLTYSSTPCTYGRFCASTSCEAISSISRAPKIREGAVDFASFEILEQWPVATVHDAHHCVVNMDAKVLFFPRMHALRSAAVARTAF